MTTHAEGTFENAGWDEQTLAEFDEHKLSRAEVQQTFSGDLTGPGTVAWDMVYRPDGTANFVGLYRLDATLDGRRGTIVLQTTGAFDGQQVDGDWLVVGSTGDLAGLSGTGTFSAPMGPSGTYAFDYDL
jgi:hypothetical protein